MNSKQFQFLLFVFTVMLISTGCSVSKDPIRNYTRQLQAGIVHEDTSFVYHLPYAIHTSHRLVQGYFSRYSHKNRIALDFKMKRGTEIFAARSGVIVKVKEDGNRGGWNKKYRPDGNLIIVQHADGSRAGYWHLQQNGALVSLGDSVLQGQLIGLSGKTGYTLFPHLHFLVWCFDVAGHWQQIATRFKTSKGNIYLRPYKKYFNPNP